MSHLLRPSASKLSLLVAVPLTIALSGCGVQSVLGPNSTDVATAAISGHIQGGPNPVVGAQVVLYSTTSTGYGIGNKLVEATQTGTSTHQDTDSHGNFSFPSGYTCPANQFAYIVAYGGNSGSGNNPNSVLMSVVGPCANLTTSTRTWVDELTTVAAGYALSNFITITGNSVNGYTVGIGSDAQNNSATGSGCVANAYYGASCTTTAAYGLGHAFTTAANLVSTTTGQVNATTTNGAVIPAQLVNTLGNVLQSCVNSSGGGTSTTTGLPTTTTTSSGTSHDGTVCGRLSAYTSYTSNGTSAGTLNAAGNTLGYIQNLAKRPGGTVSLFDSACDSNTGNGTTSAATCIFNLAPTNGFYSVSMSAAPPDWMLAIFYPKSSLNSTPTTTTSCSSSNTPTTLGVLYPYMLATDINDDIDILNGDGSSNVCYNVISIGFDGSPLASTQFDTTGYQLNWIANDSFGHSIVPLRTTGTTGGVIRVYATGTDPAITLAASETSTATPVANDPWWVAVDGNDNIYVDGEAGVANDDFGYLQLSGANSHLAPAYTGGSITGYTGTSKGLQISIDINNNIFWETSSSSGSTRPYFTNAGGTATFTEAPSTDEGGGSTSNGDVQFPDTTGNVWTAYTTSATGDAQGSPIPNIVFNTPYSVASGVITYGSGTATYTPTAAIPSADYKMESGAIDGNNVMWWTDLQGSITCNGTSCTTPPATPVVINQSYLHGFDTVNKDYLPTYYGCEFTYVTSTACGTQTTDAAANPYPSSYAYALYGSRGMAVDSSGNIWSANGTQGHITEIIGIAAPTWPMFIHNGVSNKP